MHQDDGKNGDICHEKSTEKHIKCKIQLVPLNFSQYKTRFHKEESRMKSIEKNMQTYRVPCPNDKTQPKTVKPFRSSRR